MCALETFLKAISHNWLERKPCWRGSRRKWEDVGGGDGLSDVFSYCSLSRSISLFTEILCFLFGAPSHVTEFQTEVYVRVEFILTSSP